MSINPSMTMQHWAQRDWPLMLVPLPVVEKLDVTSKYPWQDWTQEWTRLVLLLKTVNLFLWTGLKLLLNREVCRTCASVASFVSEAWLRSEPNKYEIKDSLKFRHEFTKIKVDLRLITGLSNTHSRWQVLLSNDINWLVETLAAISLCVPSGNFIAKIVPTLRTPIELYRVR